MQRYQEEIQSLVSQETLWNLLEGKTVMLAGATGMLGTCLLDLVTLRNTIAESPIKVIALTDREETAKKRLKKCWSKSWFQHVACDINHKIPECGNVDYIIHAASNTHPLQYSKDPVGTIASNVIGTKNLLDYGIGHSIQRFCFLSSVEIYGENRGDTERFDENYLGYIDCNTLRSGYPESKRVGESLCNAYKQAYGLDFVIGRLSRIYGPTMLPSDSKAISQFIQKAVAGEDVVLKSQGNQKYSYTFVTDAVAAILYMLGKGQTGEAYNVADEESDITLKELAQYLADIAGTKVVFEMPREQERQGYSVATKAMLDASKLRAMGWKPKVTMKKGLGYTVECMRHIE